MDMVRAASLFGSNAFASPVGQQIERVTDSALPSEDWTLILEICDIINETDEGPKDAIKAIRKRLGNHKNYKSILYTLTVSEACVKNCGPRFHKHVATKEFLGDLTKLLGQKGQTSNVPQVVQEKVLSLIQSWSDAFRNAPDLQSIKMCYDNLRSQGYEFPAQDLDKLSPIFTPNVVGREMTPNNPPQRLPAVHSNSSSRRTYSPAHSQVGHTTRPNNTPIHVQQQPGPAAPFNPTVEQLAKLRGELDVVEGNVRVLSEMLNQLQPGQESNDDYELLVELNNTCREMQKRVQLLIDRIANDEVTGVLLRVNDNLNNVFIRYDRHERNRKGIMGEIPPETVHDDSAVEPSVDSTPQLNNLIQFGMEENPSTQSHQEDEFDIFAQSRTTAYSNERDMVSTYEDNTKGVPNEGSIADVMCAKGPYPPMPPNQANNKTSTTMDEDIEDVEQWLKETNLPRLEAEGRVAELSHQSATTHTVETSDTAQPMTSSEFDKFLSDRASSGSQQRLTQQQPAHTPPRQMTNVISDKTNEEMFGL